MKLNFGRFRGYSLQHVPGWYFAWLVKQDWLAPDIKAAVEHEAVARRIEVARPLPPAVERFITLPSGDVVPLAEWMIADEEELGLPA